MPRAGQHSAPGKPAGGKTMSRFPSLRPVVLGVVGAPAVRPGACGSRSRFTPPRGQVFVGGKPAEGAVVVLHPVGATKGDAPKPSGRVGADGSFTLSTVEPGDGAPA